MDHPESSAVSFRRRMRRKLYKLASASEFHLHDDVETTNWMRQKVESTLSRIRMAISKVENAIILILGPPGSGKTYLVRSVVSRIHEMKHLNESGEWRIQVVGLESYNHKDEMRCLKELLMKVEKLAHVNIARGISMTFQEVHERLTHALKLLRRSKVYLIVVLEGADVLTKGINDCSITTGSCTRHQGLLYLMGNILQSQDFAFTFICITADIRTTERLEKRVKSRFMHESVYCQNKDDIGQIFGPKGLAILGPKCEATLDTAAKMALSEDIMCGNNVSSLVTSACVVLPDDAIEELDGGRIRISSEAMSNAIMHTREKTYITKMLEQLTLPEHQILVALTRLHTRRMNPITLLDVEEDLAAMIDHFPSEKHTVPDFQGLLRVFLRLIQVGIVEWVNYEHNWVGSASTRSRVDDFQGTNAPCRFAHYRTYLNMDHSKILPSHLSVWLSLAVRTMK